MTVPHSSNNTRVSHKEVIKCTLITRLSYNGATVWYTRKRDEPVSDALGALVRNEPVSDALVDEPVSDALVRDEPVSDILVRDEPVSDTLV